MAFTVTATQGGGTNNGTSLQVKVLTGAIEAGGNSAANFGSGVLSASFTPTFSNSLITVALDNVTGATAFTLASNNTSWNSDPDATDGFTGAQAFYSGAVTAGTPVTVGATAPTGQNTGYAIFEVKPSGGSTPVVDGSSPAAVNSTTTSAVTAAFSPPPGSVLVAMVACNGTGAAPNTTITMSDTAGLGLVWTQRAATATGGGAFIFTATVPGGAAAPMAAARPGQTWLRRFHHRQILTAPVTVPPVLAAVPAPLQLTPVPRRVPQRARLGRAGLCAAGVAVAFTVPAPGAHRPPAPQPRPASRAHTGPQGLPGGGTASQVVTPRGTPARPQPFVFRSPLPGRARTGRAGLPGAGIASAVVTPLGSPPSPAWRLPVPRRLPDRAQVGPGGRNAAGIASQIVTPLGTPGPAWRPQPRRSAPERALWRAGAGPQPAAVTTVTAYQHAPPPPRSPAPRRALWRGLAVTAPQGTPGPAWRAQPRRAAPRRALWRGYGSPVVTPLGTPTVRRPVFTAPGRRTRATVGHGQVGGGNAGPQAVAPIAPQAYQHPPPPPRRPAPRRALWRGLAVPAPRSTPGPAWRAQPRSPAPRRALWHGGTGPQPVTAAPVIRQLRQPRPAPPRRALWRGLGSRIVTPLGIPSRKPPPPANTPRKRQRALWRRGAGPQPPPPTGLLAGTTAGPPASRWQAALPAARWQPRPAASRWQAALPAARYDAGNPAARWQAGPPVKGRYSMRVVTGSVEYIQFPVAGPPGVDVTTFPVEVAVVTEAHGEPGPSDPAWTAGSWLGGLASLLIDETALGNGDYVVYGRLTATPEKPVVRSGRVRLGPAA